MSARLKTKFDIKGCFIERIYKYWIVLLPDHTAASKGKVMKEKRLQ